MGVPLTVSESLASTQSWLAVLTMLYHASGDGKASFSLSCERTLMVPVSRASREELPTWTATVPLGVIQRCRRLLQYESERRSRVTVIDSRSPGSRVDLAKPAS